MELILAQPSQLQAAAQLDSHIPEQRLEKCIGDGFVYLLMDGGNAVGILRYSLFWQTIPFLDLIYLTDAFRCKGLGTVMINRWEAEMAAKGFSSVLVSTQADETAYLFYEKRGYRPIGSFLPPEQSADELIYLKTLSKK